MLVATVAFAAGEQSALHGLEHDTLIHFDGQVGAHFLDWCKSVGINNFCRVAPSFKALLIHSLQFLNNIDHTLADEVLIGN